MPDEKKMLPLVPASALPLVFDREKINLIKATVAKDATDDELKLFIHYCLQTGLDPLSRQIYFFKGTPPVVAIDGYRLIASRTGRYRPDDESPRYTFDQNGRLLSARVKVFLYHEETRAWYPCEAEAIYSEYFKANSPIWSKMPRLMLAKCAEANALRKAFPDKLSGVYTEEEIGKDLKSLDGKPNGAAPLPEAKVDPPKVEPPKPKPKLDAPPQVRLATPLQQEAMAKLFRRHKLSDAQLQAFVQNSFSATTTAEVTYEQATNLIQFLQDAPTDKVQEFTKAFLEGDQSQDAQE